MFIKRPKDGYDYITIKDFKILVILSVWFTLSFAVITGALLKWHFKLI